LLKNNCIVSTIMSNFGFLKTMEEAGINVIQAQVGDRYVIQDMLKHEANLGGEQSGHTIFLDHNTTGDGIVSALQVLRIMIETNTKLSTLAATIKNFPQVQLNVKVKMKPPLNELKETLAKIKEAEASLADQGSVLVRYSGTEQILRVTIQGSKQKHIDQLAKDIAIQATKEIDALIGKRG
jgi:phosphoglucosamine mutase